jgi:transposase
LVDALGNPLRLLLTGGQCHEITKAQELLQDIKTEHVIADRGFDADKVRDEIHDMGAVAVIPAKANRKQQDGYDTDMYQERHLIECFFGKLKQYRRVFSRFDQTANNYLAFVHFASMMIWLR